MLFNSVDFFLFFPLVLLLHFAIPRQHRWFILLIASYFFYMYWKWEYILLILISTVVDYFCALKMPNAPPTIKRRYLYLSLITNLTLLTTFKYLGFFTANLNVMSDQMGLPSLPIVELILPMGISFYTFQTMGYTIDVYNGKVEPEPHIGKFGLYVSFFPQLVAGPIERAGNLIRQIHHSHPFNLRRTIEGSELILWGLFKKVVIADRLALFIDPVYSQPQDYTAIPLILATLFFAVQIYTDFSGYSDIAIGSAKILGYDLMTNFKRPYFASNIDDFWKRWHISLSTWFRDYLYIPLGGRKVIKWRWYYNLFITFVISGLWHGANWTFIVWGVLHGFYLITFRILEELIPFSQLRFSKFFKQIVTFVLVLFAWIFFRANSLNDAWFIVRELGNLSFNDYYQQIADVGMNKLDFLMSLVFIFILIVIDFFQEKRKIIYPFIRFPKYVRWGFYYLMIFSIIMFGVDGQKQFIYFQF